MRNFNKRDYFFIVIAELSRDSQDYKEDWFVSPLPHPYTILMIKAGGGFETLDGKRVYKSLEEPRNINDVYVSATVMLYEVIDMFYAPIEKMNELKKALEEIELHEDIDISKQRLRKIGF